MGKDNKKDAKSAMRWRTGMINKKEREAMQRYGLDPSNYGYDRPGQHSENSGDYNDMQEDFTRAARNDYDTRRGLEAMAMSGKKKAQDLAKGGLNNASDVMNANNMQRKMHGRMGNGGDFSSASDFAGVSYGAVERDRKKQTEGYRNEFAAKSDLNSLKDKLMAQATEKAAKPIEPSDRMTGVEERLNGDTETDYSTDGLYSKNNEDAPKTDDQADAARNFLTDYKFDVKKGANLRHDINTGLSNAARAVTDNYGR